MFTPARYLVLDDEVSELDTLIDALHALGVPCVGIRFDPLAGLPDPDLFVGLRILFSDLHLVKAQPAGVQHYNTLGSLLDHCVPEQHGPYLLVLWTSHEHERAALTARLEELLPPAKRPLAVLALDKTKFQVPGGEWDSEALKDAIREQVSAIPQLEALLNWEKAVLAAANATLALVGSLVPDDQRTIENYAAGLDRVLSILAKAAAGSLDNAQNDRKGSVSAALAPLLADRIMNQPADPDSADLWERAVTFAPPNTPLEAEPAARMHRMLHFAFPPGETVTRQDWGAVIPLGDNQLTDPAMLARFGVTADDLRDNQFKLKQGRRTEGRLIVIRGGANCDQAQAYAGPIPLLLGMLVPATALKDGRSPAIYSCGNGKQLFQLDGYQEPVSLLVHARFSTTVVADELAQWPLPIMRIREQLLSGILVHAATNAMRPGTLRF